MENEKKTYCGSRTVTGHGSAEICGQLGEGHALLQSGPYQCGDCRAKDAETKLASLESSVNLETQEYVGKPEEVGGQLLADAIGPAIESVAKSNVTAQQMARMFAGMVAVLAGMVADNFGPEAAAEMLRGTADKLANPAPPTIQ